MKAFLGFFTTLIILGGLVWLARPENAPAAPALQNQTALTATSYDFGRISMSDGKVSYNFPLTNEGPEPLVVKRVFTSCMCTTASLSARSGQFGPYGMPGHGLVPEIDAPIAAGETASVKVLFDPAAHGPAGVGRIERVVTLENSAGDPIEFQIAATVTP